MPPIYLLLAEGHSRPSRNHSFSTILYLRDFTRKQWGALAWASARSGLGKRTRDLPSIDQGLAETWPSDRPLISPKLLSVKPLCTVGRAVQLPGDNHAPTVLPHRAGDLPLARIGHFSGVSRALGRADPLRTATVASAPTSWLGHFGKVSQPHVAALFN